VLPEYDFDRDELVYREEGDGEVRREAFDAAFDPTASQRELSGVSST
jgi:hypothetical protein